MPLLIYVSIAILPGGIVVEIHGVIDVQKALDSLIVEVVSDSVASEPIVFAYSFLVCPDSWMVLVPLSNVVVEGVTSLVSSLTAISEDGLAISAVFEWVTPEIGDVLSRIHSEIGSVEIVPVEASRVVQNVLPDSIAHGFVGDLVFERDSSIEKDGAAMLGPVPVYIIWDQIEVFHELGENWLDIEGPISGTIANDEALQIHFDSRVTEFVPLIIHFVVLVDLPSQVRGVNAAVALA